MRFLIRVKCEVHLTQAALVSAYDSTFTAGLINPYPYHTVCSTAVLARWPSAHRKLNVLCVNDARTCLPAPSLVPCVLELHERAPMPMHCVHHAYNTMSAETAALGHRAGSSSTNGGHCGSSSRSFYGSTPSSYFQVGTSTNEAHFAIHNLYTAALTLRSRTCHPFRMLEGAV